MQTAKDSRFDADSVGPVMSVPAQRRLEMRFTDSEGKTHVVSLPLPAAVQLGCLICDLYESAPYVVGATPMSGSQRKK